MFRMTTFDYMDNIQKKNVELKEFLKKLKHEGVGWIKLLKEKEEEKEKLKIDLINLTLEQKNHVKDSKILEEAREANLDLKTQLEEAKRIEEALRNQSEEKEVTNQKHEFEIVNLRKKIEKSKHHEKFNNSSVMLDKLFYCQRSPFDKSGLGFRKVEDKLSPKTPNVGPSMTKDASYVLAHDNKDGECSSLTSRS